LEIIFLVTNERVLGKMTIHPEVRKCTTFK